MTDFLKEKIERQARPLPALPRADEDEQVSEAALRGAAWPAAALTRGGSNLGSCVAAPSSGIWALQTPPTKDTDGGEPDVCTGFRATVQKGTASWETWFEKISAYYHLRKDFPDADLWFLRY